MLQEHLLSEILLNQLDIALEPMLAHEAADFIIEQTLLLACRFRRQYLLGLRLINDSISCVGKGHDRLPKFAEISGPGVFLEGF